MRTLALVTLLAAIVVPAVPRADDGPATLKIEVGDEAPLRGFRPICDDPSIATVSAEGKGTLKALRVGETTCSWSVGNALGPRRVFRVVVIPPRGQGGQDRKGGREG